MRNCCIANFKLVFNEFTPNAPTTMKSAYFYNIARCKFSAIGLLSTFYYFWMCFCTTLISARYPFWVSSRPMIITRLNLAFYAGVHHVKFVSSNKKMFWQYTRWVVTPMANKFVNRDISYKCYIGKPVCEHQFTIKPKVPVSLGGFCPIPYSTSIHKRRVGEKFGLQGFDCGRYVVGNHHASNKGVVARGRGPFTRTSASSFIQEIIPDVNRKVA